MNKLTLVLSLAAGLAGGFLAQYLAPRTVFAQNPAPKEVRAQSFVLVDPRGTPVGLFGFGPDGRPVIRIVDDRGRVIWSAGTNTTSPATQ